MALTKRPSHAAPAEPPSAFAPKPHEFVERSPNAGYRSVRVCAHCGVQLTDSTPLYCVPRSYGS